MYKTTLHILFTDVTGAHRRVSISINGKPEILEGIMIGVDGSSIPGYSSIEKSDLYVKPASSKIIDLSRFNKGYWVPGKIVMHDGREHPWDPRLIADKLTDELHNEGYISRVGCELEFYVVENVEYRLGREKQYLLVRNISRNSIEKLGRSHYASNVSLTMEEPFTELINVLNGNAVTVSKIHRENGFSSQYEISLAPSSLVGLGDDILLAIASIREVLRSYGLTSVFLPKPFIDDYGSGLHIHVSLWSGDRNLFFDGSELSNIGRYFIGGILEHAESLTAFTNPSTNSYRRLIEGFEAPVYVSWGIGNRSTMVRIPLNGGRIEIRTPDASMNPYLGLSAIILAGLDGVKRKIDPGDPISYNVYEKREGKLRRLPRSLEEAVEYLISDNEYLRPIFPRDLLEYYAEIKLREARRIRSIPGIVDYITLEHLA
ncbi:glutamine synthetase family protein [Desulfurococcus amylolyticus]|uniref:Glutamine synthetase catalytic region n=1 Tax=Desulfurococcus amylolyticus DSM 16532 TaxID=768672 RepID=I3XPY8_DESAM|nr:glutamine synthetase family protein [Desulfurococcus amylolyticus]AFL66012.1 glutamine synthetase catalytic region [Desulfurococcus amylolyticus DSM 16532]